MLFYHDIDPVLLRLGFLNLYWYSFFLAAGVLLCYLRLRGIYRREGLPQGDLDGMMFYAIVGMFFGARMGYALFYQPDYFLHHPAALFALWKPGLSSHGAAFGVLVALLIWSRKRKLDYLVHMSLLSLGLPLILLGARIGNFINSEAFGIPTGGEWGVVFTRLGEIHPRHPNQLYEAITALALYLLLNRCYQRFHLTPHPGVLTFLFGALYFSVRFLLDFYKSDPLFDGIKLLSLPQLLSLPPIFIAIIYFMWISFDVRRH